MDREPTRRDLLKTGALSVVLPRFPSSPPSVSSRLSFGDLTTPLVDLPKVVARAWQAWADLPGIIRMPPRASLVKVWNAPYQSWGWRPRACVGDSTFPLLYLAEPATPRHPLRPGERVVPNRHWAGAVYDLYRYVCARGVFAAGPPEFFLVDDRGERSWFLTMSALLSRI